MASFGMSTAIFTPDGMSTFHCAIEMMLEATEWGHITFSSQGILIEAVDANWICAMRATIPSTCFHTLEMKEPLSYSTDFKLLHEYLRGCKGKRNLCLVDDKLKCPSGDTVSLVEEIPYGETDMPITMPETKGWTRIRVNAREFSHLILDQSVGLSQTQISVSDKGDITITTDFEMGTIEHHSSPKSKVMSLVHANRLESPLLIVKFLKLASSWHLLFKDIDLLFDIGGCVLQASSKDVSYELYIREYTGPRDVQVSPEYLSVSLDA